MCIPPYLPTAEDTRHQHAARMRRGVRRPARASGRGSRPQRERQAAAEKSPLAARRAAGEAWTPRLDWAAASACLKGWCYSQLIEAEEFRVLYFSGLLFFCPRKGERLVCKYVTSCERGPQRAPRSRCFRRSSGVCLGYDSLHRRQDHGVQCPHQAPLRTHDSFLVPLLLTPRAGDCGDERGHSEEDGRNPLVLVLHCDMPVRNRSHQDRDTD